MIQGSQEWLQARVGKVTASRVREITATTKSGGWTAGRKNYLAELLGERLNGEPEEQYVSAAMIIGLEREPTARFEYALKFGVEIEEVGFIPHPTIIAAGASPDGLVGKDGMVEIKCPNRATHIDALLGSKIDPTYMDQMLFQMACLPDRKWCDFVSYYPTLPKTMQLHVTRIMRDNRAIEKIELEVTQFIGDLDATVDLLQKRYLPEAAE